MTDQYDEIAARLLPCTCDDDGSCPADHRPAVAAELRRLGAELDAAYRALNDVMNFEMTLGGWDELDEKMNKRHGTAIAKARKHVEDV